MKRKLALSVLTLVVIPFIYLGKASATTQYSLTYYPPTAQGWLPGGSVTSNPAGINCGPSGSACIANFDAGTSVTLTASSNSGYSFVYFGSPCPGTAQVNTCNLTMNGNVSLDSLWQYSNVTLQVSKTGTGLGTVTSSSGGINCGSTCSVSLTAPAYGGAVASVTLTATPSSGSTFSGWQTNGSCASGGGRGDPVTVNTNPVCSMGYDGLSSNVYTVVPKFDKVSTTGTSSSTAKPSSSSSTATPSTVDPVAATASSPVQLSAVTIDGAKTDTSKSIEVAQNKPLVLSGKTVPNGIVTLTIHSNPKTVTTTADKDGNWSYTVTGLAPGNHTVQASVKDPATGQSSAPAQLLAFTVKADPAASVDSKPFAKKTSKVPLIFGLVFLLLLAGGWYYWTKIRHPRQTPSQIP